MKDLIKRLEKAEFSSRELDAEIFILITPGVAEAGRIDRDGGVVGWWPKDRPYQSAREVPRYTNSVDAAIMLVPPDRNWELQSAIPGCEDDLCQAECRSWNETFSVSEDCSSGWAKTPALALCAAALSARAWIRDNPR